MPGRGAVNERIDVVRGDGGASYWGSPLFFMPSLPRTRISRCLRCVKLEMGF